MAREIVITSVPRGVKLGRTGFQVAMQTAGLRDDLAAQLEKMAGYRHLPTGVPNPVCYFHRVTKTFAGPVSVLGRIVDAGVDFSNRSNKLAHMVVLEAADVGQVASSTPAAVLAAVEGRLATTWPGPAEERREPFSIAGVQASQPARCGLWQQVMGDAGWAGVLAERAVRGQATLIIGRDSSPESCRRMLALFQEALAIVPPAKRWGVTFDTATLAPEGVLWRGTYAGSPESQTAQPGVLVIDLARPQPIPQNLEAGELVTIAREGPPRPVMPKPAGSSHAPSLPGSGTWSSAGNAGGVPAAGGRTNPSPVSGPGVAPPPTPLPGDIWHDVPSERTPQLKTGMRGWLIGGGIALAVVSLLGIVGVGGLLAYPAIRQQAALGKYKAYAQDPQPSSAPGATDLLDALNDKTLSQERHQAALDFFNEWLASVEHKGTREQAANNLKDWFKVVQSVMGPGKAEDRSKGIRKLCAAADPVDCELVARQHAEGFQTWADLSARVHEAKDRRIARKREDEARRDAVEVIRTYAQQADKNTPPDRACYCRALGLDESTMDETCVAFLNDALKQNSGTITASLGKAPEKELLETLRRLDRESKAVLAKVSGDRGLTMLIEGRDGGVGKLLDALHPDPFPSYDAFQRFVSELDALFKLSKLEPKSREDKTVGDDLWKTIKDVTSLTDKRLVKDSGGNVFAQRVTEKHLANLASLTDFLSEVYPEPEGPVGDLQKAIRTIRKAVTNGRDLAKELDEKEHVKLFATSLAGGHKVAENKTDPRKTGYDSWGPGAAMSIDGERVLVVDVGEDKLTLRKGEHWSKHKDVARFVPIGFFPSAGGEIQPDDWIVLSPPQEKHLPSDESGATLYDLMTKSGPVKVPIPPDVQPLLKLSPRKSLSREALPLTVGLQVDSTGTAGVLTFMKSIQTVLENNEEKLVDYVLTERVAINEVGEVVRPISRSWVESQSRIKPLKRDSDKEVSADLEPKYVGYKTQPGKGDGMALRELTDDKMLAALVQATTGDWTAKSITSGAAEKYVSQWRSSESEKRSLRHWKDSLREWLLDQREGFADECRKRYREDHTRPKDPGSWGDPQRREQEDEAAYQKRLERLKAEHRRMEADLQSYEADMAGFVDAKVKDPQALREYVELKTQSATSQSDPSAEVAAACFLLEIDGLIVAKVCRAELEEVLKRIPVGALVEGTVPPREWDSWIAEGGVVSMGKKVSVPELKFVPAKLLDAPQKQAVDAAAPEQPDGGATTP